MVASLTRAFGMAHLGLAEDVVQEALARALQTWPYRGVPENPAAWLMRAARNLALDVVRREAVFRNKEAEIVGLMETDGPRPGAWEGEGIADDRLRMMFACCHPKIPVEAQLALALKVLGGFSPAEIARAFLTTEAAVAKRLTRARQRIREAEIRMDIPDGPELSERLGGVLHSLYLLFNEGYKASTGDRLVREEICAEAIRLARLLAAHPAGNDPRTHALLALMLLSAARFSERVDDAGNLLRLQDQDRSAWDRGLMAQGMFHLAQSSAGPDVSVYHLQAGIAVCHCLAKDYASTDWPRILELYDELQALDPSPVVALNRAVALAEVKGPQAGLEALACMRGRSSLETYHLYHATVGELTCRLGRKVEAGVHFQKALALTQVESEKRFLKAHIAACGG